MDSFRVRRADPGRRPPRHYAGGDLTTPGP
jgi:hypothetical protein